MSEDITFELLQRAIDADDNLGEATKRFIDRHVDDPTNPPPRAQDSPIDLVNALKSGETAGGIIRGARRRQPLASGQDHDRAGLIASLDAGVSGNRQFGGERRGPSAVRRNPHVSHDVAVIGWGDWYPTGVRVRGKNVPAESWKSLEDTSCETEEARRTGAHFN